jgi:hypothetical protein
MYGIVRKAGEFHDAAVRVSVIRALGYPLPDVEHFFPGGSSPVSQAPGLAPLSELLKSYHCHQQDSGSCPPVKVLPVCWSGVVLG